ncbi:uncharacterized protein LOC131939437 [Physella acuta]|uniref:uncharacterized protein LOC131939437 n=1 Tax=Physella acuta TaxID=109671 RepID=UPI0027DB2A72|nr:uncharacterized protein LOC131939437 [Physella acuta]
MVVYSYFIALILIVMVTDPGLVDAQDAEPKCPKLGDCGVRIMTCIEKDKHMKCLRAIIENQNCDDDTIDDATSMLVQMKDAPCEGSLDANAPTTNRDATTDVGGPVVEEETTPIPPTQPRTQTVREFTFPPTERFSKEMERSENSAKAMFPGMLPIFLAVASVLLLWLA